MVPAIPPPAFVDNHQLLSLEAAQLMLKGTQFTKRDPKPGDNHTVYRCGHAMLVLHLPDAKWTALTTHLNDIATFHQNSTQWHATAADAYNTAYARSRLFREAMREARESPEQTNHPNQSSFTVDGLLFSKSTAVLLDGLEQFSHGGMSLFRRTTDSAWAPALAGGRCAGWAPTPEKALTKGRANPAFEQEYQEARLSLLSKEAQAGTKEYPPPHLLKYIRGVPFTGSPVPNITGRAPCAVRWSLAGHDPVLVNNLKHKRWAHNGRGDYATAEELFDHLWSHDLVFANSVKDWRTSDLGHFHAVSVFDGEGDLLLFLGTRNPDNNELCEVVYGASFTHPSYPNLPHIKATRLDFNDSWSFGRHTGGGTWLMAPNRSTAQQAFDAALEQPEFRDAVHQLKRAGGLAYYRRNHLVEPPETPAPPTPVSDSPPNSAAVACLHCGATEPHVRLFSVPEGFLCGDHAVLDRVPAVAGRLCTPPYHQNLAHPAKDPKG